MSYLLGIDAGTTAMKAVLFHALPDTNYLLPWGQTAGDCALVPGRYYQERSVGDLKEPFEVN